MMRTAQATQYGAAMDWADGLSCDGISHIAAGAEEQLQARGRAVVLWDGEYPVGLTISNSFETSAPPASPPPLTGVPPARAAAPDNRPPSMSVVICTRDRPDELARCLASFPRQTRPPDEIVVVDNASRTKDTRTVCRQAGVLYVHEPRPGLDIARNTGAKASTGEIVAYTDDDVVLHPRWLERLGAAFDAPEIWAVTGLVLPAELATPAQWHFERYWGFGRGFQRTDFGPDFLQSNNSRGCPAWLIGAGASMAFRRSVFDQAGFFDERLDVGAAGCSGDSEFWHRILCAGGTCRYEPTSVAFHYHRREWTALRKQIRAYMRGHSAALLVQYERSGRMGNLRRLLISFPAFYAGRMARQLLRGKDPSNLLVRDEIAGLFSGIWFYLRTPRSGTAA
jgi:GT2 family glycosyltransferase